MLLTKRNLSSGDARRAGANQADVLRNEASPLMIIEGACVLEAWQEGDSEYAEISLQAALDHF